MADRACGARGRAATSREWRVCEEELSSAMRLVKDDAGLLTFRSFTYGMAHVTFALAACMLLLVPGNRSHDDMLRISLCSWMGVHYTANEPFAYMCSSSICASPGNHIPPGLDPRHTFCFGACGISFGVMATTRLLLVLLVKKSPGKERPRASNR